MKYLTNISTDPYFNLAFDDYCLREYQCEGPFFWLWKNRPSVIIGLNQNAYGEVNLDYLHSHGISLARRVTGGGAVYHDLQNLNYSIVGKCVTPEPFIEALRRMGVPAELSGRNDIFVDGRKVSGYARRVWHGRELIHGTLMFDVDIETLTSVLDVPGSKLSSKGVSSLKSRVANLKDYLPGFNNLDQVQETIRNLMADGDAALPFPDECIAAVRRSVREKFSTWEWNYGHSHQAGLVRKEKLPCGTVEAFINLNHGIIADIAFSGDFLGKMSVRELADRLKGIPYKRDSLSEFLRGVSIGDYFQATSKEEILDLLITG